MLNKSKKGNGAMKLTDHFLESKAHCNFPAKWNREFEKKELKKCVERVKREGSIKTD